MEKQGTTRPGDALPPTVVQEVQYDPWGLALMGLSNLTAVGADRFTYNGKEGQQGLEWLDYGARMYDPLLGRWNSVDPLIELDFDKSGYGYVSNNPVRRIDLFGLTDVDGDGKDDGKTLPEAVVKAKRPQPKPKSDPFFGRLWEAYENNQIRTGHHSPYQKYFQAGGRDAAIVVGAPAFAIWAQAGGAALLTQGSSYVGRTRLFGFVRSQFFRNPLSGDLGWKTLLTKGGISLMGQTVTSTAAGETLTKIDMVGLLGDMFFVNGYAAIAGGLGEVKINIGTLAPNEKMVNGSFNPIGVGLGKFAAGFGFGYIGEKIGASIGPNAMVDMALKLYNEVTNKVVIEGASTGYPTYKNEK